MSVEKELIVKDNELIIDDNTKISSIKNKDKYTKITITKKINPMLLNKFKNIKELVIDYYWNSRYKKIFEVYFDKLSFVNNLEKLTYKNIYRIGSYRDILDDIHYFYLYTPSLTTIEFPENLSYIYSDFLKDASKLETIIFNINNKTKIAIQDNKLFEKASLMVKNCNLKKIIIKTKYNTHEIKLDYKPKEISDIYYSELDGIVIEYNNEYIKSKVTINNNIVNIKNTLIKITDNFIIENCLFIPDYINNIKIEGSIALNEIKSISINPKLINENEYTYEYIDKYIDKKRIEKIIIRNNNEMSLYENKEYFTKEYGTLKNIYIKNQMLYLEFDKILFSINKEGNITKISNKYEELNLNKYNKKMEAQIESTEDNTENVKKNYLNLYSSRELEYYTYYKKILELISPENKEIQDAMNIVENELIKKLKM